MGPKKRHEAARCIFCGRHDMSKEHLFSDWMQDLLWRQNEVRPYYEIVYVEANKSDVTKIDHRRQRAKAPMRLFKPRNVCQLCNNGWMSRIEIEAKPHLLGLFHDSVEVLTQDAAKSVARWATLKTMVHDGSGSGCKVVSQEIRNRLKESGEIPASEWTVCIARTDGKRHHDFAAIPMMNSDTPITDASIYNALFTSIWFGHLYIYVANFHKELGDRGFWFHPAEVLTVAWPLPAQDIAWKAKRALTDQETVACARSAMASLPVEISYPALPPG